MSLFLILLLAFLLGFLSKTADLLNEHGLRWFKYIDTILGFIWGLVGIALVLSDVNLTAVYMSTVLYWFLRIKLDFPNHAIAGAMISLASFWVATNNSLFSWKATFWLFMWLAISGYINTYLKDNFEDDHPWLKKFLRLRFRYYLGPLIFSVLIHDFLPFYATLIGMMGTEIVTIWFDHYKESGKSVIAQKLGVSLGKERKYIKHG